MAESDCKSPFRWRKVPISPLSVALYFVATAFAGCVSEDASPTSDGGAAADSASPAPDGSLEVDASDGSVACQTPAPEELFPKADFSGDDGGFTEGTPIDCNALGDGGGLPAQDGGGPPLIDGGGPRPADGGGPPPGDGSGIAPALIIDIFPNEFGKVANQVMPDTPLSNLADFAETRPLGTNGRHCQTCHADENDWGSTPAFIQERFNKGKPHFSGLCRMLPTNGSASKNDELEAIFRTLDGANSPHADVSTPAARRNAYSMLLTRAVIRIGLPVPGDADFELVEVDDPYAFASAGELSLFRRSPQMANLRFNTTTMWDGREDVQCATLTTSLRQQALHAVTGHAAGPNPSDDDVATIVRGEMGIYIAQFLHNAAGQLNENGAQGGPRHLAQVPFYFGINAFDRVDPQGRPYNRNVFSLYQAWRGLFGSSGRDKARAEIAEGERVFNEKEFTVRGVSGFNDELGRTEITATCGGCHNTPNVGTNSEGRLMDIGVSDESHRTADLPLYTFREKATGVIKKTSDPGQALTTKKWAQMNRFKIPNLRALAGRAPYMHDGSAISLSAAVDYHDQRFGINLDPSERAALIAFLTAL